MSDTTTTLPQLPAPEPSEQPRFHSGRALPPQLGLSVDAALAELQRRRGAEPTARQLAPLEEPPPPLAVPQEPPRAAPELPPPDARMRDLEPALPRPERDDAEGLVVQVEVNGRLVPVSVEELRRGYLREQDYRRKTQELAEQVRRAQEAQQQAAAARQALEQRLPAYAQPYEAEFAQPVGWEKLAREDPIGSVQKIGRLLDAQQIAQEQLRLQQERLKEEQQRKLLMMQAGHDVLCRVIPGWADPPTRTLIQQAIAQHAVSLGYPAEQVQNAEVLDPREILMAWKSMNYDRLMAAPLRPEPAGARTVNGNGAYRRQPQAAALNELEERLTQTGHIDDALAVLRARRSVEARPATAPGRLRS
jgi:hypothetical protein